VDIREAFEQSLTELGINDLDDTPDDILAGLDNEADDEFPRDGENSEYVAEKPESLSDGDKQTDTSNAEVIDIKAGASIRLPDGTVVPADKAVLMQADYTRKTQELSHQRKQLDANVKKFQQHEQQVQQSYETMRQWYEQRASNPSSWIAEIASQSPDATGVIAKALYDLAEYGVLDPKFVETFGLKSGVVSEEARRSKIENELNQLKYSMEQKEMTEKQREAERQRQALVQKRAAVYEGEWEQIKASRGLSFRDKVEEIDAKRQLLQFAMENKVTKSLVDAYDLMSVRVGGVGAQRSRPSATDVSENKRASRAVTPKTSVSGASKRIKKQVSDREAILDAMEALSL
jgi:hypothetical protein